MDATYSSIFEAILARASGLMYVIPNQGARGYPMPSNTSDEYITSTLYHQLGAIGGAVGEPQSDDLTLVFVRHPSNPLGIINNTEYPRVTTQDHTALEYMIVNGRPAYLSVIRAGNDALNLSPNIHVTRTPGAPDEGHINDPNAAAEAEGKLVADLLNIITHLGEMSTLQADGSGGWEPVKINQSAQWHALKVAQYFKNPFDTRGD